MNKELLAKQTSKQLKAIFRDKSLSPVQRGERGEKLIYELVDFWRKHYEGSKIFSSLIYPQGPILPTTSSNDPVTECDIVVVTPYKILCIEVKTIYGIMNVREDCHIIISKTGEGTKPEDKNFIRQNEMHCRHLYYHLHGLLPNGDPNYIESIIVMTGNMTFTDNRSDEDKLAHPIVNTNNLIPQLDLSNQPKEFLLDIDSIVKKINRIKVNDKDKLIASQKFVGGK